MSATECPVCGVKWNSDAFQFACPNGHSFGEQVASADAEIQEMKAKEEWQKMNRKCPMQSNVTKLCTHCGNLWKKCSEKECPIDEEKKWKPRSLSGKPLFPKPESW